VLGEHGEVLESAAFSALELGARIQPQSLLHEMNRLDGYKISRPQLQPTDLAREGWSLKTPVAGFQPVSCIRRPAAGPQPEQEGMLQAIYSDGLTHVSIFIEPYLSGSARPETQAAVGATHVLTRRLGDWWITAMGDVPPLTLRQFTQALERRRP
jgi:sigma-E factor negative regulatory protein RseB